MYAICLSKKLNWRVRILRQRPIMVVRVTVSYSRTATGSKKQESDNSEAAVQQVFFITDIKVRVKLLNILILFTMSV